jgi:ABC-2 type transport system ATP-binding protein
MSAAPAVEAIAISRRFGRKQALDGISFRIDAGEIAGYIGPNGSGKTTTMRAMLGLVRLDAGELRLFGRDVRKEWPAIAPRVGVVFDQHSLHPDLTVRETLELYAALLLAPGGRRLAVDRAIEAMGLGERVNERAKKLSKGLQQRLAFARAIVHSPDLLLLDEPFDAIDTETHRHVRDLLRRLARGGTAIFLTSHDLHEVEQLASRVVILDRGRVIGAGTSAELRRTDETTAVAVTFQQPVGIHDLRAALAGLGGDESINLTDAGLRATIRPPLGVPVDVIAARLIAAGLRVRQFQPLEPTLEDAYFAHLPEYAEEGWR